MAHKPTAQILEEINTAKSVVIPGSKYFHYKHPNYLYTIVDIVIEEASDNPMVLYKGNEGLTFARPYISFVEKIEVNGKTIDRFTKVTN